MYTQAIISNDNVEALPTYFTCIKCNFFPQDVTRDSFIFQAVDTIIKLLNGSHGFF